MRQVWTLRGLPVSLQWLARIGLLLVIASILAASAVGASGDIPSAIGWLGVALGAVAVIVALAIYGLQKTEATQAERRQKDVLDKMDVRLEHIGETTDQLTSVFKRASEHLSTAGVTAQMEPDEYFEASEVAERFGERVEIGDGGGTVLQAGNVPLRVLADIVSHWEKRPDVHRGAWTISNVLAAYRKTGQGNFPWLVLFRNSAGDEVVWRVSRGGKGKRVLATVTEWVPRSD